MTRHIAVSKLIQYLRIKTVHPNPDYAGALSFLREYANEIGFDSVREIEVLPEKTIMIMSLYGKSPNESTILLNSHMDVVPVSQEFWKCDAFEGKIYENGDIYGRGVQDMKSVGIQHLELIRKIKLNNIKPNRTIHLTFVPDEEIGGATGLGAFLKTQEFKNLNVGVALDEGMASSTEDFKVYYGERLPWWIRVTFTGNTGHGSRFIENTAAEKLRKLMNKMLQYREDQKQLLEHKCSCLKLGDVTTINLTSLSGGIANNIVPAVFKAVFDIRLTPKYSIQEFEEQLKTWIQESEDSDVGSIQYEHITRKESEFYVTSTDQNLNKWWKTFSDSCSTMGIQISKEIFPASTDARFIRELNIPAFGFTPLNNTPVLLHDHNEFVNDQIFIKGIDILYNIVLDLANS